MSKQQHLSERGFTVIELVFVVLLAVGASFLAFQQINSLKTANDNAQRKTAINSMYYALEEVYYKNHGSYPQNLKPSTLPSVDPELFTDPDGFTLGKEIVSEDELQKLADTGDASDDVATRLSAAMSGKGPNYHYAATDCDNAGNCKKYKLRADLTGEAEYIKSSRDHK